MGKGYKGTPIERFLKKIKKLSEQECWIWIGGKTHDNYGKFWFNKTMKAHKVSYLLFRGKIPNNLCVLHLCDKPDCVNPKHLWLGTQLENIKDRDAKGRTHKGKKIRKITKKYE